MSSQRIPYFRQYLSRLRFRLFGPTSFRALADDGAHYALVVCRP